MELSQLQYFVAIAELQNISKASERLNISQPSLSKSISRLEQELGTKLFDRVGKRIVLNDQGSRFLAGVQLSLQDLEEARSLVEDMAEGVAAKISLGLFCSHSYLGPCIQAFISQYPQVEFVITSNSSPIDRVDTDMFDMILYPESAVFKKYRGFEIARERFLLAMSASHPFAAKDRLDMSALAEEKFVFLRNAGRTLERPFFLCMSKGFRPKIRCTTDSLESHHGIISLGLAIGFLAEGDQCCYAMDPSIVLRPIPHQEFSQSVSIGFRREKYLSEPARLFRDFVLEFYGIDSSAADFN